MAEPSLLAQALADYDGRHKDVLEAIRDGIEPQSVVLDECIALATADDPRLASGATWLLRAWVEAGAGIDASSVRDLAGSLERIVDLHARLHVCQTVRSLEIPAAAATPFAAFLQECRRSPAPFLRAWATDGLHHLGAAHGAFAAIATTAVEEALQDPAPSVRARARRLAPRP